MSHMLSLSRVLTNCDRPWKSLGLLSSREAPLLMTYLGNGILFLLFISLSVFGLTTKGDEDGSRRTKEGLIDWSSLPPLPAPVSGKTKRP